VTTLRVPREQLRSVLDERIRAGEDLVSKAEIADNASGHGDWLFLFSNWRDHTIAELRAVYDGDDVSIEFDVWTRTTERSSPRSTFPFAKSSLEEGLKKLRDLVERLPLAVEPEALQVRPGKVDKTSRAHGASVDSPNVFIIHGRSAGGFRDSVARFIEQLGLSPIILADQASEGRTLIEKFEASALDVGYAIALLTPEDSAYGPDDEPPPRPNRARQNVILELGYFMASLGRKNVVALRQEGLEVPTDILGIVYIPLDDAGAWKTLLARELNAAGYDIDLKKLLG
jgi:predicted nucleotide-binding protein